METTTPKSWARAVHIFILATLLFSSTSLGHMVLSEPPPIQYKTNPFFDPSKADFDYTAPLSPSGSNYPCRSHLKYLDTPMAQSVRTYQPGQTYELRFDGAATHGGGSCQLSLSYDRGATWKVFKSYIGGCVRPAPAPPNSFNFMIPQNAPLGDALFSWTWFNNLGNREMYMNCAVVTIGGATPRKLAKRQLDGPNMFLANIGNGCSTPGATDLVFPDPGVDVEYNGDESKRANPIGNCGPVAYTPPPPPPPGSPDTGVDNGGDNGLGQGDFGGGDMGPVDPGVGGDFGGNTGMNNDPLSTPGNENILDEQRGDCPYWMAQGYVCSDATTVTTALTQGVSRFFSLHFVFPVLVSLGFGLFR